MLNSSDMVRQLVRNGNTIHHLRTRLYLSKRDNRNNRDNLRKELEEAYKLVNFWRNAYFSKGEK